MNRREFVAGLAAAVASIGPPIKQQLLGETIAVPGDQFCIELDGTRIADAVVQVYVTRPSPIDVTSFGDTERRFLTVGTGVDVSLNATAAEPAWREYDFAKAIGGEPINVAIRHGGKTVSQGKFFMAECCSQSVEGYPGRMLDVSFVMDKTEPLREL